MNRLAKCKCGAPLMHHNAITLECPKGAKHRTLGYSSFGPEVFELKIQKNKSKWIEPQKFLDELKSYRK